jgi:hypothetical protein
MIGKRAKARPASLQGLRRAYFIRRKSQNGDGSQWFCTLENQPIYFDKVSWASMLMTSFLAEQKAQVVYRPVGEGDVAFSDWLKTVLPKNVTPEEYLAAVEQTVAARRSRKDVTRRQARRWEEARKGLPQMARR